MAVFDSDAMHASCKVFTELNWYSFHGAQIIMHNLKHSVGTEEINRRRYNTTDGTQGSENVQKTFTKD